MIDGVIVYDQWLFIVVSHKIPFCKNFGAFYLFILSIYLKFKNYLALPNFKPIAR